MQENGYALPPVGPAHQFQSFADAAEVVIVAVAQNYRLNGAEIDAVLDQYLEPSVHR